jgi:uncharacterized membrane protein YesL
MANSRFVNRVYSNTQSDLIEITEDKLENILIKYLKDYRKTLEWTTPLGLCLSFLITFLTADFKDFFSIPKETWCAIFYILLALSIVWTIYSAYSAIYNIKRAKIGYLINKIKNN